MGSKLVIFAVTGEEGNSHVVMLEDVDRRRWIAPWCFRIDCCDWDVSFELLETSTTNYGDVDRPCGELEVLFPRELEINGIPS